MRQPTFELSQEQITFFHREGYLAIDTLTTYDDVERLRVSYDTIFDQRAGRDVGDQFDLAGTDEEGKEAVLPQILNPAKYAPEMNESLLLANAARVSQQLLGVEAECRFAHAMLKPPRTGAETPWHQDAAYWSPDNYYHSISIWVPLQKVTPKNGCMQFVPGSQVFDVLQHRSLNDDPRIHALELVSEERSKVQNVVTCPLAAGGATIHGPYMLHHTAPNCTDFPRRAVILNGGQAFEQRDTPLRFPWLEQQRCARDERVRAAIEAGLKVDAVPTGDVPDADR